MQRRILRRQLQDFLESDIRLCVLAGGRERYAELQIVAGTFSRDSGTNGKFFISPSQMSTLRR